MTLRSLQRVLVTRQPRSLSHLYDIRCKGGLALSLSNLWCQLGTALGNSCCLVGGTTYRCHLFRLACPAATSFPEGRNGRGDAGVADTAAVVCRTSSPAVPGATRKVLSVVLADAKELFDFGHVLDVGVKDLVGI